MATVLFFDISESAMKWGAVRDGEWISGDEAFFPVTQRESRLEMTFRELDPLYSIETWDEIRVAAYPHMHGEIKELFAVFGHSIVLYNRFEWLVDKGTLQPHMHLISFDMEQCHIATLQDGKWQCRSNKGYGAAYIADCLSLEEEYDHPKYQFYTPLVSSAYYKMLTCNKKMKTVELPGMQESIDLIMEYGVLHEILNDKSWVRIWNSFMSPHAAENWQEEGRVIVKPDAIYVMGLVENELFEQAIKEIFMTKYGQEVQFLMNGQDRILSNLACHFIDHGELENKTSDGAFETEPDVGGEPEWLEMGTVVEDGLEPKDEIEDESGLDESTTEVFSDIVEDAIREPITIVRELEDSLGFQKSIVQEVRLDDQFIYWGGLSLDWIEQKKWSERQPQVLWIEMPYKLGRYLDAGEPYVLLERLDELEGMEHSMGLEWWKGPVAISFTADLPSEPFPMREACVRQSIRAMLDWASDQGWDVVGMYAVENVDWAVSALYKYFSQHRLHRMERIVIQPAVQDGQEFQAFSYMMKAYEQMPTISLPIWSEKDLYRLLWVGQKLVEQLEDAHIERLSSDWKFLFHAYLNDSLDDNKITRTISDAVGLEPNVIFKHWCDEVKGTPRDPAQPMDGMDLIRTMSILECWVTHVPHDQQAVELLAQLYERMEIEDRPLCRQVLEAYAS